MNMLEAVCDRNLQSFPEKQVFLREIDNTEGFWNAYCTVGNLNIFNCVSFLSSHPLQLRHARIASEILMKRHQVLRCCIRSPGKKPFEQNLVFPTARKEWLAREDRNGEELKTKDIERKQKSIFAENDASYWIEKPNMKPDVQNSQSHNSESIRLRDHRERYIRQESPWQQVMVMEQDVAIDVENGPLWRLRCLPSKSIANDEFSPPDDTFFHGLEDEERHGINAAASNHKGTGEAFPYTFRTYIVGIFHHSVMDGISRKIFWNEFAMLLLNLSNYELFLKDLRITNFSSKTSLQTSKLRISNEEKDELGSKNGYSSFSLCDSLDLSNQQIPKTYLPDPIDESLPKNTFLMLFQNLFVFKKVIIFCAITFRKIMQPLNNPFPSFYPPTYFAEQEKDFLRDGQTKGIRDLSPMKHKFTGIIPIHLSEKVSSKIQKLCRSKGLTVNGLITAAAAIALSRLIWKRCEGGAAKTCQSRIFPKTKEEKKTSWWDSMKLVFLTFLQTMTTIRMIILPFVFVSEILRLWKIPGGRLVIFGIELLVQALVQLQLKVNACLFQLDTKFKFRGAIHFRTMQAVSGRRFVKPSRASELSFDQELFFRRYLRELFEYKIKEALIAADSEQASQGPKKVESIEPDVYKDSNKSDCISRGTTTCSGIDDKDGEINDEHSFPVTFETNVHQVASDSREAPENVQFRKRRLECQRDDKAVFGSFAFLIPFVIRVDSHTERIEGLWKLASSSSKQIIHLLENAAWRSTFMWQLFSSFINKTSKWKELIKAIGTMKTSRFSSFLISNGGKWDLSPVDEYSQEVHASIDGALPKSHTDKTFLCVESSWSLVAQHNTGLNYFAHNVVTLGGRICWSLQFHSNLVSNDLAALYARQIVLLLEEACSKDDSEFFGDCGDSFD